MNTLFPTKPVTETPDPENLKAQIQNLTEQKEKTKDPVIAKNCDRTIRILNEKWTRQNDHTI